MKRKLFCGYVALLAIIGAGYLYSISSWAVRDDGWPLFSHDIGHWGFLAADKSPDKSAGQVVHFAGRAVNIKEKTYVVFGFDKRDCIQEIKGVVDDEDFPVIVFRNDKVAAVEVYSVFSGKLIWRAEE